jgi:tRNA nucleotidyltransferase (CCA-adding enzyme)
MEMIEFDVLNFFSLVILSELTIKYVIRFGKFTRIVRNQRKWYKEFIIIFNLQWNSVVCRSEDFVFHLNGIV